MVADHYYRPGFLNGKCARRGCGLPIAEHPPVVRAVAQHPPAKTVADIVAPKGNCPAEHNSIEAALLIGDGGLQWRACPVCGEMVEPRMVQGMDRRFPYGPGRLPWTRRQMQRLEKIRLAFVAGYFRS